MGELDKRFPRYSKLLSLYPLPYRQRYKSEVLQTLADMLDAASTAAERRAIWLRVLLDTPTSLTKENIAFIGGSMNQQTPNYVKATTVLSAALILPFFVIVFWAKFDNNLHNSTLWHPNVLLTWLVILPGIAFLASLGALFGWLKSRKRADKQSFWRELFDLRRNLLLLASIAISFGIITLAFGHDTGHCVNGNPLREIRNAQGVWSCIQKS